MLYSFAYGQCPSMDSPTHLKVVCTLKLKMPIRKVIERMVDSDIKCVNNVRLPSLNSRNHEQIRTRPQTRKVEQLKCRNDVKLPNSLSI